MCRFVRLLLLITSLSLTGIAWASDQILIKVTGLTGVLEKNVTQALKNKRNEVLHPITDKGAQAFYKKSTRAIKEALQPYGYFKPTINSKLSRVGNQWTATFNIAQGPPVHISQVSVGVVGPGKTDRAFIRMYAHLPVKVGQILNTEKYEKTKQLLYDLASTRGYFDAKMLENKIYINLKTLQARIYLKFKSGPRFLFGKTTFSKNPFSPSFLLRFLRYKRGRHYNYHKIDRTQQDFINSNYFSQVIINPMTTETENLEVPIHIKILPRKRFAYIIGVGYGTDTGARGTLGFDMRRVNQYGHQIKAIIQGAKNNSYASATYFIPGRHPASDVWAFNTSYANFRQITGTGRSFKTQASYTTSLGNWKQTVALTFLNERYNIVGFPFTKAKVLYPNMNWQYITKHRGLHPKHGFSFTGFMGGTPSFGASNNGFFQARITMKSLFTLFNTTRFLFRTTLARTQISQIQSLPFSLQLFAGGPRSIRGYSYNQIGPGKNLFIGSVEIQQRIYGNFYLVGFFDAGNATSDDPFKKLNEGVGPGIAWLSPVGIIEVTIARAITQPNRPWVIQFTMGPDL